MAAPAPCLKLLGSLGLFLSLFRLFTGGFQADFRQKAGNE
jgi:hypothetical protein